MRPKEPDGHFAQRLQHSTAPRDLVELSKFLCPTDLVSVAGVCRLWYAASWSPEVWIPLVSVAIAGRFHPKECPDSEHLAAVLPSPYRLLCKKCAPRVSPLLPMSHISKTCPTVLTARRLPAIEHEGEEYTYRNLAEDAVREHRVKRLLVVVNLFKELKAVKTAGLLERLARIDYGLLDKTPECLDGQFDTFLLSYLMGAVACGRNKLRRHVARYYRGRK